MLLIWTVSQAKAGSVVCRDDSNDEAATLANRMIRFSFIRCYVPARIQMIMLLQHQFRAPVFSFSDQQPKLPRETSRETAARSMTVVTYPHRI